MAEGILSALHLAFCHSAPPQNQFLLCPMNLLDVWQQCKSDTVYTVCWGLYTKSNICCGSGIHMQNLGMIMSKHHLEVCVSARLCMCAYEIQNGWTLKSICTATKWMICS